MSTGSLFDCWWPGDVEAEAEAEENRAFRALVETFSGFSSDSEGFLEIVSEVTLCNNDVKRAY